MAARLPLALLLLALPLRAGVTLVNGDATVVQAAIDAAADGDILVLAPGQGGLISNVSILAKSLTLVADGGAWEVGHVRVRDLPAGGQVTLRGLAVNGWTTAFYYDPADPGGIEVRDCAGSVWLDACTVVASAGAAGGFGSVLPAAAGLMVRGSPDVVASDCSFTGGVGPFEAGSCTIPGYAPSGPGGDGVRVLDGRAALLHCTVTGGAGGGPSGQCSQGSASPGGAGLRVQGTGRVVVQGGVLHGAADTTAASGPGAGLVVEGAASAALRGTAVAAGTGTPATPDAIAPPGALASWPAAPRGLQVTSPLRVGQAGTLTLSGAVGDLVAVFESPAGGWLELPGKQGVFALGAPLVGPVLVLSLPAETAPLGFSTPPVLPPGTLGLTVLLQVLGSAGGQVTVDDVASCTVLDASIP